MFFNVEKEKIEALSKVLSLFDPKSHILITTSHNKVLDAFGIEQGEQNNYEWIGIDSTKEKYIKIAYRFSGHAVIKPFIALLKKANLPYNGNGNLITVFYPYEILLDDTRCVALVEKIKGDPIPIRSKAKETGEEQKSVPANDITLQLQEKSRIQATLSQKEELDLRQRELALERAKGEKKYRANGTRKNTHTHDTEQNTSKGRYPGKKYSNSSLGVYQAFHSNTMEAKTGTLVRAPAAVSTVAAKPCEQEESRSFTRETALDMRFFLNDRLVETPQIKVKVKETKSLQHPEKPKKKTDSHLRHLLLQYEDKDERLYNGKFIIRAIYHKVTQEIIIEFKRKDLQESERALLSQLRVTLVHYFCMNTHWDDIETPSLSLQKKEPSPLLELATALCNKEDISSIANKLIKKIPDAAGVEMYLALMNGELACLKAAFVPFKDNHYIFSFSKDLCQVFSCVTSVCIIVECFNRLHGLFPHISTGGSGIPINLLIQCRSQIRNPAMHECEDDSRKMNTLQGMLDSYLRTAEVHTLILELVNFPKFSLKPQNSLSTAMSHFPSSPQNQLRSGPSGEQKEGLENTDRTYSSQQLPKTAKTSP